MQINSVPSKMIALSALPIKDVKVRRFFILADGKRSWREICQLCLVDEDSGALIAKTLVDGGYLSNGESGVVAVKTEVKPSSSVIATGDFVSSLTKELANYVGPIASILVKQIDLPEKAISRSQIDKVLQTLVQEIDSEQEKEQFLANMSALFKQ